WVTWPVLAKDDRNAHAAAVLNKTSANITLADVLRTVGELTLRVLRSLTGLLEAGFLPLYRASIASEEACFFQRSTVIFAINLVERTCNAEAYGTGLAGWSATVHESDDVVCAGQLKNTEWVVDFLLVQFVREVSVEVATIDFPWTGTWDQADTGDGALATTNSLTRLGQWWSFGHFFGDGGIGRFRGVAGQLLVLSDLIDVFSYGFSLNLECDPTGQPDR